MHARPLELVLRQAGASPAVRRVDPGAALLGTRPRPVPVELREVDGAHVLTTADRRVYLRLDAQQHHLWTLIDGQRTVAEIATAYFLRHGALHVGRVGAFITSLRRHGLVEVAPSGFLRERGAGLAEWRWHGAHDVAELAWRAVGPMFHATTAPIWAAVLGLGAYSWAIDTRLAPTGAPTMAGATLLLAAMHVFVHELGHAMAVVAAGRQVRYAAVGLAGFYVDSTDLFLGTRREHAIASLAGPFATALLTAACALLACAASPELAGALRPGVYLGLGVLGLTLYPFALDNDGRRAWGDLAGEAELGWPAVRAVFTMKARPSQWIYTLGALALPALLLSLP
ncbi:MAG: hypothetical protein FJ102_02735 [Deltaproteobacteria bacterium]|nr:hypothetical protein [Deltaproteobacteria bacterium]